MKLGDFFKDRLLLLVSMSGGLVFTGLFLSVFGLDTYAIGFLLIVLILDLLVPLILEFMQKHHFYSMTNTTLESLDQKFLLLELLERPHFQEGMQFYNTLREVTKSMNDHVAESRAEALEYREYIEAWVHEVKTPIASSKLILENNPSPVSVSLEEELSRIDVHVEQVLYYARSSSVEKDYFIREVSLSELVNRAIRHNAKALISSGFAVQTGSLCSTVMADPKWLDFILGQLIMNSIKYRSAHPLLTFSETTLSNAVLLCISDNGIGIADKDLRRVFDKGFTGNNGRALVKSTGMGLFLCKKLCDKLGLKISIDAMINEGTTVRILFSKSKLYTLEP